MEPGFTGIGLCCTWEGTPSSHSEENVRLRTETRRVNAIEVVTNSFNHFDYSEMLLTAQRHFAPRDK